MVQFVQKCKENFFDFLGGSPKVFWVFQGEKNKVTQNDARSLKKIGCNFQTSGGGLNPGLEISKQFFFSTLYPSLRIIFFQGGLEKVINFSVSRPGGTKLIQNPEIYHFIRAAELRSVSVYKVAFLYRKLLIKVSVTRVGNIVLWSCHYISVWFRGFRVSEGLDLIRSTRQQVDQLTMENSSDNGRYWSDHHLNTSILP